MIQHVLQRLRSNRHVGLFHVREIQEPQPPRFMIQTERPGKLGWTDGFGAAAEIGLRPHAAVGRTSLISFVAGVPSCLSRDSDSPSEIVTTLLCHQ